MSGHGKFDRQIITHQHSRLDTKSVPEPGLMQARHELPINHTYIVIYIAHLLCRSSNNRIRYLKMIIAGGEIGGRT